MMRVGKKLWMIVVLLLITGLFISSTLWAAPPQDYTLSLTFRNPDGTVFRITKYYLGDDNKFRVEYLTPVQYHVNDGAELQAEKLTNVEANTVEILRKDKGLVWSLDPSVKDYVQVPLKKDAWERAVTGVFAIESHKLKKTGTTKFLNYPCDIYESERDGWTTISVIEPGTNIIFRSELREKNKLVQIMEATEFCLDKPAAALFEIPAGYKRGQ
jgi:hypothetical protein